MIETALIFVIFSAAVFYIGKNTFKAFFAKNKAGCAKGCGSCGAVDFDKIATQNDAQNISTNQA